MVLFQEHLHFQGRCLTFLPTSFFYGGFRGYGMVSYNRRQFVDLLFGKDDVDNRCRAYSHTSKQITMRDHEFLADSTPKA